MNLFNDAASSLSSTVLPRSLVFCTLWLQLIVAVLSVHIEDGSPEFVLGWIGGAAGSCMTVLTWHKVLVSTLG